MAGGTCIHKKSWASGIMNNPVLIPVSIKELRYVFTLEELGAFCLL